MPNHKLIVEAPDSLNVEYVVEEKNINGKSEPSLYIMGEYMMAGEANRNKRVYCAQEMAKEVARYSKEYVDKGRALGELNHPESAEVSLEKACHLVTELKMDRSRCIGKSKVLEHTPCGKIVSGLIKDGVQVGVSSRALGKLIPMEGSDDGINKVQDMKLIAIDCVADPSNPGSFVDGILENKQFIINSDGKFEATYDEFESKIGNLPTKDVDAYLKEQVINFINNIS